MFDHQTTMKIFFLRIIFLTRKPMLTPDGNGVELSMRIICEKYWKLLLMPLSRFFQTFKTIISPLSSVRWLILHCCEISFHHKFWSWEYQITLPDLALKSFNNLRSVLSVNFNCLILDIRYRLCISSAPIINSNRNWNVIRRCNLTLWRNKSHFISSSRWKVRDWRSYHS